MDPIELTIVAYPPFKLRSSMIDKDPVIWQHMLEVYIALFEKLIAMAPTDLVLSEKSQQQLAGFFKIYLHETSEESTKVFSLGAINPDIVENQKKLKEVVLGYFKVHHLDVDPASMWNFARIYTKLASENVATNQSLINLGVVRDLLVPDVVQTRLLDLVADQKFKQYDLATLYSLLGSTAAQPEKERSQRRHRGRPRFNNTFASKFVTAKWVKSVETLYNDGESIHSKQCVDLMLVSLTSLTANQLSRVISQCQIRSMAQFKQYPLFAKIILSSRFHDIYPDIKLPQSTPKFDSKELTEIISMFPQLTEAQAKTLVHQYGDVTSVVNRLLEHPDEIKSVKPYQTYDLDGKTVQVQIGKKNLQDELAKDNLEELKKKSLTQALRMMYEDDEDEPDDTYAENELTEGPAIKPQKQDTSDERDVKLFLIYKQDSSLFATKARHSTYRQQLKSEFHWTDEQLEGWAKMLERNPRKYMLLEQNQIEGRLNEGGKTRTHWTKGDAETDRRPRRRIEPASTATTSARQQRIKSQNKAKRANHNRKSAHDRKVN